jgi:hypothetical protein
LDLADAPGLVFSRVREDHTGPKTATFGREKSCSAEFTRGQFAIPLRRYDFRPIGSETANSKTRAPRI